MSDEKAGKAQQQDRGCQQHGCPVRQQQMSFLHRDRECSPESALPDPFAQSPQASSFKFLSCTHC